MDTSEVISAFLSRIGKLGGSSRSGSKRKAAKQNIRKAIAKRWPGRPKVTGFPQN